MKKLHLILLVITAIMALFSAYSLAAINQVYKIDFEWYSQYNNSFSNNIRETSDDKWVLPHYPNQIKLEVIRNKSEFDNLKKTGYIKETGLQNNNFENYVFLYCTFGSVDAPEYRIKVVGIAQRGNVVEIKVSVNSPAKSGDKSDPATNAYYPEDIIRINKTTFPDRGKLYFIFKNQAGKQLDEKYCEIK